ncbi:MAG: DUF5722 domain-containing protein [Lachnospiraceae bacterium]|nr:DUF5722 domain-containing protein [Lachnospiraceae bacterium]
MNQKETMDNRKKKLRKKTIDKEKVAENKKKIKEKKRREKEKKAQLKKRMKEQQAKIRLEAKQGAVLEDEIKVEESVVVKETGAIERTIKLEETYTIEEQPDEEKKRNKQKLWKRIGMVTAAVLVAAVGSFFVIRYQIIKTAKENASIEAMVHMEAVELAEYSQTQHQKDKLRREAGKDATRALVEAARYMMKGFENRPPEIELTESNASDFATIESCVINSETGKIDITMSAPGLAVSDDGYYYLFEENTYDTELGSQEYIIEDQKDVDLTFSINLNYNTVNSRLFSKFVIAVLKDGKYMAISQPKYITNPEAIAKYHPAFPSTSSKKGLLVDPERIVGGELDDLGVKHAAYNIPLSRIIGNTSNAYYPTVYYTYNGKTYAFNGQIVAEYDYIFSELTKRGITTTAIILNDMSPATMTLIHPKARSGGSAPYYAFNAANEEGTEYLAAVGSFLASRYSGSGHGTVMNWVIGNEINARKEWNYIEYMDTASYVEEYAKAFRVFYNAILSINGNARVYISLDQQWAKSLYSNGGYGSKEIMDEFNRNIKKGGNIDWAVAQHPYNFPLTSAKAWSTSGKAGSYILDSETTPVLSIRNIHVLSDYLQKEDFLTDSGEVRHIILSEMGYTSSTGQDLQSASFIYAYKVIEANQYIDSMLLSRQTDASAEIAQGLALGINTLGGGRKSIYNAYKYIDTEQSAKYTDFALDVIGISSWSEVIRRH